MYDSYPNITLTFLYNISDLLVYIIDFQCCKNSSIALCLKSLQILGISAIKCISHTYENPYTSNKYLTWLAQFFYTNTCLIKLYIKLYIKVMPHEKLSWATKLLGEKKCFKIARVI